MPIKSNGPWHVPGKWFVSPHYWEEAVQKQMPLRPGRVSIKEDLLREGEETPGVVFTVKDRVEIARRLQELGVAEIEMPRASAREQEELLGAMRSEGVTIPMSFLIGGFSDWQMDIARAVAFGAEGITLLFAFPQPPGFPTQGRPQDPQEILDKSLAAIACAKSRGLKVGYGAPSTTRTPLETVIEFYQRAAEAGADRVHVYDSRGVGMSAGIRYLVQRVKEAVGKTSVLFHGHNDLGMATANTVAAVEGGAEWVDVVVNGLGDRAGNASLEEVVTILHLHGIETGIQLEKIGALSRFIEEKTGVRLQPNKAIVGTNAFLEESASHFLTTKEAEAMGVPESPLPFVPELVGRRHVLVFGTTTLHGGAIEYMLREWGYPYTPGQLDEIRTIASREISVRRYLSDEEFRNLCRDVLITRGSFIESKGE